jgi:ribosomal protein S11
MIEKSKINNYSKKKKLSKKESINKKKKRHPLKNKFLRKFRIKQKIIEAIYNTRVLRKQIILNNLPEDSLLNKANLFKTKLNYFSKIDLIETKLIKKYDRKLRIAFNRRKFILKQYRQLLIKRDLSRFKKVFVRLKKKRVINLRKSMKKKRLNKKKENKLSHLVKNIIFRVIIRQSKNNMFLTFLNNRGRVLYTMSAGSIGLFGPQRATPFASEQAGRVFGFQISRMARYKKTFIILKTAINRHVRGCITFLTRSFRSFKGIIDLIPRPHNGLRKKKLRRL